MEIKKHRLLPVALKFMRYLNARMKLTDKEKLYYFYLEKGYAGELLFDQRLTHLSTNCLILNDLLLECNNTEFQNDTFLISQDTLYQFEVKNYEGDYYIEDNKWYTFPKNDIKNPMLQLERSETLVRQLVRGLGFHFTVKPYLIFVNPHFHLYHAPMNLPIIYPTQLERFINRLNLEPSKLTEKHINFADKLLSLHLSVSKNMKIPAYSYEQLEKSILCSSCYSLDTKVIENRLVCKKCGCIEHLTSAVLRTVEEYVFLFPNCKITTNTIYEFCKIVPSKKTIRRILLKYYKLAEHGRSSYFE